MRVKNIPGGSLASVGDIGVGFTAATGTEGHTDGSTNGTNGIASKLTHAFIGHQDRHKISDSTA